MHRHTHTSTHSYSKWMQMWQWRVCVCMCVLLASAVQHKFANDLQVAELNFICCLPCTHLTFWALLNLFEYSSVSVWVSISRHWVHERCLFMNMCKRWRAEFISICAGGRRMVGLLGLEMCLCSVHILNVYTVPMAYFLLLSLLVLSLLLLLLSLLSISTIRGHV